jgi:hypothetical protein
MDRDKKQQKSVGNSIMQFRRMYYHEPSSFPRDMEWGPSVSGGEGIVESCCD